MMHCSAVRPVLACLVGLCVGVTPTVRGDDWPQFRGPNSVGVTADKTPLPVEFAPGKNIAWVHEVGEGICSPVVAAGRVFTTAMHSPAGEPPRFVVSAFEERSGQLLWRREFDAGTTPLPAIHETNSYASATPAADADRVYVYFTRLGLAALDARTGETAWRQELPEPFFIFDWGPGMSPVLHGETVYFCQDDDLSPALYAFDRRSGKLLWKDDRSDMAVSYSHPIVCQTPEGVELAVAGTGRLLGYDPATGRRKWASQLFCRNIKTTPVFVNNTIYVSVESTGISYQWRAQADADGDGRITRDEVRNSRMNKESPIPEAFWKKFERGDVNGDGVLEGAEIDRAFLDPRNQGGVLAQDVDKRGAGEKNAAKFDDDLQKEGSFQAVRPGGAGDVTASHVIYKKISRSPDHLVSPLVTQGRIWFIKGGGLASCFDAQTGQAVFEKKRIGNEGAYLASPVAGDGKIYVAGQNGVLVVLADKPELEILAKNDFEEPITGTPALANGRVLIRTRTKLYSATLP
jgi:outer membrane protein assembly factor BamB